MPDPMIMASGDFDTKMIAVSVLCCRVSMLCFLVMDVLWCML